MYELQAHNKVLLSSTLKLKVVLLTLGRRKTNSSGPCKAMEASVDKRLREVLKNTCRSRSTGFEAGSTVTSRVSRLSLLSSKLPPLAGAWVDRSRAGVLSSSNDGLVYASPLRLRGTYDPAHKKHEPSSRPHAWSPTDGFDAK